MPDSQGAPTDEYGDIRPYLDYEVTAVIERLCAEQYLLPMLADFQLQALPKILAIFKPWLSRYHAFRLRRIKTVLQFQNWLAPFIYALLDKTTSRIHITGLEKLDPQQTYLWISSHRDIAMDPLMINYALHTAGWQTSQIAIGDNLLLNQSVADVMRLNKSFIVPRSITDRREKLKQYKRLSSYIAQCITQNISVWIAQREGRAKDNQDITDKAVLKMLSLFGRDSGLDFQQSLRQLHPVPVYIQYEWDPCDLMKAKELVDTREQGRYKKSDKEDVVSLVTGLLGNKGEIYVKFGTPLSVQQMSSPELMATHIDKQLKQMQNYSLLNQAALQILQSEFSLYQGLSDKISHSIDKMMPYIEELKQRIKQQNTSIKIQLLESYARPLLQTQTTATSI